MDPVIDAQGAGDTVSRGVAVTLSGAVLLRESDLHLPRKEWGRNVLAAPASRAGTA